MIPQPSRLIGLVQLVDQVPVPCAPSGKRGRGRPPVYDQRLFLKALVIMQVRKLSCVGELLAVLKEPTQEMQTLKHLLTKQGLYPSRRTFERRLAALSALLPEQINCFGRFLLEELAVFSTCGRAVAIDSSLLRAKGPVWHQKARRAGHLPSTRIDQEAHWGKSGWHGFVYGYKLHLVCATGDVWLPLAAYLSPGNAPDNLLAPRLLQQMPSDVRFVLADSAYRTQELEAFCFAHGFVLISSSSKRCPNLNGAGKEVRRLFHLLRSVTIENFTEQFKAIFNAHEQVPTKGLIATCRYALGALFVYQLALWYRYQNQQSLRVGLKAFLKAA